MTEGPVPARSYATVSPSTSSRSTVTPSTPRRGTVPLSTLYDSAGSRVDGHARAWRDVVVCRTRRQDSARRRAAARADGFVALVPSGAGPYAGDAPDHRR